MNLQSDKHYSFQSNQTKYLPKCINKIDTLRFLTILLFIQRLKVYNIASGSRNYYFFFLHTDNIQEGMPIENNNSSIGENLH